MHACVWSTACEHASSYNILVEAMQRITCNWLLYLIHLWLEMYTKNTHKNSKMKTNEQTTFQDNTSSEI